MNYIINYTLANSRPDFFELEVEVNLKASPPVTSAGGFIRIQQMFGYLLDRR